MNHFVQPKLLISSQAKKIGLALINDLELCITARLAFYLDVNPSYDGHEATFIWKICGGILIGILFRIAYAI